MDRFPETNTWSLSSLLHCFLGYSFSLGMSLFYMWIIWRHLEGTITVSKEPEIAKLDSLGFYFFLSFKDPFIGPDYNLNPCSTDQAKQTVAVPGPLSTALEAGVEFSLARLLCYYPAFGSTCYPHWEPSNGCTAWL